MNTDFFNTIFKLYSSVQILPENKNFYSLDNLVYYLADEKKSIIKANDIIEIDIRSAFPTICRILFKDNKNFIDKLNSLNENKLERNIFISTTLKDTGYLKQLNLISKMIISSCVMDVNPKNQIFELKKDGILYSGESIKNSKLYNYYTDIGFNFHENKYKNYIRYQRTSHFLSEDSEFTVKGIFKDRPHFLTNIAKKILIGDQINYQQLNDIYSNDYYTIIRKNILDEIFSKYYLCNNNKFLTENFRYEQVKNIYNTKNIIPKNYLKLFIYPLLMEI